MNFAEEALNDEEGEVDDADEVDENDGSISFSIKGSSMKRRNFSFLLAARNLFIRAVVEYSFT